MARIRFHKRPACGAPFAIARGFGNARGVHAKRTPFRFHIGLSVWFSGARIYGSAFSAFLPAAMRGTIVPVRETAPQISNTKATSEVKGGPFCVIPVLLAGCAAVAVGWGQKVGRVRLRVRRGGRRVGPKERCGAFLNTFAANATSANRTSSGGTAYSEAAWLGPLRGWEYSSEPVVYIKE